MPGWLNCPEHAIYEAIVIASINVQIGKLCYITTRLVVLPWQSNGQILLGITRVLMGKESEYLGQIPYSSRKITLSNHAILLKN